MKKVSYSVTVLKMLLCFPLIIMLSEQNREFQLVQLESTQLSGEHREPNMVALSAEPSTPWPSAPSLSSLKATVKVSVGKPDMCEVGLRSPNVKQLLHLQLQAHNYVYFIPIRCQLA